MFDNLHGSQLETHVKLIGFLVLASGIMGLLGTITMFCALSGIGMASGDPEAARILSLIGLPMAAVLGGLSVISLVAGYGMVSRRSWGRVLGLLDACLGLVFFPIGTLLGIYAFFVLLQKDAEAYFDPARALPAPDFYVRTVPAPAPVQEPYVQPDAAAPAPVPEPYAQPGAPPPSEPQ